MRFQLLSISFLLLLSYPAAAEYIPPSEISVSTPAITPEVKEFREGVYYYDVSWQGVVVASIRIVVERGNLGSETPPYAYVRVTAKSAKVIDLFYKLRHTSESLFRSDTFAPISYFTFQRENSRKKYREVLFTDSGKIRSRRWKNGKSRGDLEFETGNPTLDPITAAFLARTPQLEIGKSVTVDVFNGKHRFLITFSVDAKDTIQVGEVQREAYKVVPRVTRLTDTKEERRLKSAALWISADKSRDILRLESDVWIGSVKAEFDRYEPSVPAPLPLEAKSLRARMEQARVSASPLASR